MPIIEKEGSVFVEYTIPEEIDNKIPQYFYYAMAGELCSIFGPEIFQKITDVEYDDAGNRIPPKDDVDHSYYYLDSSSGGWYEALRMTCKKLDMEWLLNYLDSLEWYDSDIFDGIIEARIIEYFIEAEDYNCNVYYQYLISRKEKE